MLTLFAEACAVADGCCAETDNDDARAQILCEKGHILISWGNSLLKLNLFHDAINRYDDARQIYLDHPSFDQAGVPQALTNLAIAANQVGDPGRANLALQEAKTIAQQQHDYDQVHRILVCAVQIGSDLVPESERLATLVTAAQAAVDSNRWPVAIRRFAIAAQYDLRPETAPHRLTLIQRGQECASRLDGLMPDKCKLCTTEAQVLEAMGVPPEACLNCLLQGAAEWQRLFAQNLGLYDSFAIGRELHWHFRRLAELLMNLGRVDEALLTFEAGRALAHLRETNPTLIAALLQTPIFLTDEGRVDLTVLRRIQESLSSGQLALSVINIPHEYVLFAVRRDGITYERLHVADTQDELDDLMNSVLQIRYRLEKDHGQKSIPAAIVRMTEMFRALTGTNTVVRLVPHGPLHGVPWRTLCRHAGMQWDQLSFATVFSLLPLGFSPRRQDLSQCHVIGMGFDDRGNKVFRDEPKDFTLAFGQRGQFVEPCSEQNVRSALGSASILDLSCHGRGRNVDEDASLILRLEDSGETGYVDISLHEICPESVASQLVILSACYSGVYNVAEGDFPVGGAPLLLQRGAQFCLVMRFAARPRFAYELVVEFGKRLAAGAAIESAFAVALDEMEARGADLWSDLACAELLAAQ